MLRGTAAAPRRRGLLLPSPSGRCPLRPRHRRGPVPAAAEASRFWRLVAKLGDALVAWRGPPDLGPAANEAPDAREPAPFPLGGRGITLAGGCFWCLEAALAGEAGVEATRVGYTGGALPSPRYAEVASRQSGHVEAVAVKFRAGEEREALDAALRAYLRTVDATDDGGNARNRGPQYRPCVFHHGPEQAARVRELLDEEARRRGGRALAVRVRPAHEFHEAEEVHQKWYEKNGLDPAPDTPEWMGAFLD